MAMCGKLENYNSRKLWIHSIEIRFTEQTIIEPIVESLYVSGMLQVYWLNPR